MKKQISCCPQRSRRWWLLVIACSIALTACSSAGVAQPSPVALAPSIQPITVVATTTPSVVKLTPTVQLTPRPPITPSVPQTVTPVPPTTTPAFDLVLMGGTLIDGSGGAPLEDAMIAIRGNRIVAVGRVGEVPIAPGTPTRDLSGQTILPGLINAHVHTDVLTDDELSNWTRAEVTTIRDLGGPRDAILARRALVATSGNEAFPRLLVAGPIITVPGGHPIPVYGPSDEVLAVRGPEDTRQQVTTLLDAGADVIKIAVSGRTDVDWPELSNEEIQAITETAHARGVRVSAHVDRAVALRRAVEHGIDDAAHMPRDHMPNELIALMVERNAALVPTIDVYEALAEERGAGDAWRQTTLPIMQDNLRRFVAAGGTLALGDDYGNPGVALGIPMAEIKHWLEAGLTPTQVLVAATQGSAQVCGLAEELGQIRPGMLADMVVVEGDPLTDMQVLQRVTLVIHNGVVVAP